MPELFRRPNLADRARNVRQLLHRDTFLQRPGDGRHRPFPHAVGNQVCTAFQQYGPAHGIWPVVIMCQPPKRCLNAADNHRNVFIFPPDQVAVDDDCPVRPSAGYPARRIAVRAPALLCRRIMTDHGIHIAGRYQKAKTRLSKRCNAVRIPIIRLCENTNGKPLRRQYPAD